MPEATETNATALLVIEDANVAVWQEGKDRFLVTWPGGRRVVHNYKFARVLAHETAEKLSASADVSVGPEEGVRLPDEGNGDKAGFRLSP
jgi:hypothetical protein